MKNLTILITILTLTGFSFAQSVEIKDSEDNVLIQINDEGTTGSIYIPGTTLLPGTPTNELYAIKGSLYWSGNKLGTYLSSGGWTDAGTIVRLVNITDKVGIGTTTPTANLHVSGDDGFLVQGTFGNGTTQDLDAGTRMHFYPKKGAFRVGGVNGTQWDDANIGPYSTAMGWRTTASGDYSTAMGIGTTASGWYSTAMGGYTTASGDFSTAMGYSTTASGWYSTAMGRKTTASGDYSTAMGREIEASGDYSVAIALGDQLGTNVTQANTMAIMGGKVGIGTVAPAVTFEVSGTDAIIVPIGTTAEQPGTPTAGMIRFNSTNSKFEGYTGSAWVDLH